jgi:predicted lipoprotein
VRRRRLLGGVAWFAAAPLARAQTNWRDVAVPAYAPQAFVDGALEFWYVPHAQAFAAAAARLAESLQAGCGPVAQAAWRDALLAWVRLSAVAIGPLIERRSARRIDFQPTRPATVQRTIALRPAGEAAFEHIGSAAKGFAALEWLLWDRAAPRTAEACAYARELALDIGREADALQAAFVALRDRERDDAAVVAQMSEAVNQWIGGIELLRMQGIERPLHEAQNRGRDAPPAFPRAASGASGAEREARWKTLRALAVFDAPAVPAAGEGLVPLETYLRGKGLNPLADKLRSSASTAGNGLASAAPATLQASARRLAGLKTLVERDVAPALDVRVGFSDADGD